ALIRPLPFIRTLLPQSEAGQGSTEVERDRQESKSLWLHGLFGRLGCRPKIPQRPFSRSGVERWWAAARCSGPFLTRENSGFPSMTETNRNVRIRFDIVEALRAFQADDEGSIPFTCSNLSAQPVGGFDSRESGCNSLMLHVRFSPRSGEMRSEIKLEGRFLIPPFGGSSPPAPARI